MIDATASPRQKTALTLLLLLFLLGTCYLVYRPGLSGPFLFDDRDNILVNQSLKIDSLSTDSLLRAAESGIAGPLKRPVAMISFALNHYFSGGTFNSRDIKLTNILIHGLNAFLVFVFLQLLLHRLLSTTAFPRQRPAGLAATLSGSDGLALLLALLWAVHPIQLTSVLYAVQRMTSLAATFSLLSLIAYLQYRQSTNGGYGKPAAWLSLGVISAIAAIFTKENALLIPPFVLLLDLFLYGDHRPWNRWQQLQPKSQQLLVVAVTVLSAAVLLALVLYVIPSYQSRPFSLAERVLTEFRVLFFYISLIVFPLSDRFGLHHDDISLSTGLVTPLTTLPSVLGLVAITVLAIRFRKRLPLASFGFLWFLVAHALESTIFPLEIAHEHRNYLASLGILLALAQPLVLLTSRTGKAALQAALLLFLLLNIAVTHNRAVQWSGAFNLFSAEARNHPRSASANFEWAGILQLMKKHAEAEQVLRGAAELDKRDPSYLMWWMIFRDQRGQPLDNKINNEIIARIRKFGVSPTVISTTAGAVDCLDRGCKKLAPFIIGWIEEELARKSDRRTRSYLFGLLGACHTRTGRIDLGIKAYSDAYLANENNVGALVNLARLLISAHQKDDAARALAILQHKHRSTGQPPARILAELQGSIEKLK